MSRTLPQFTETAAKRLAYGLTATWVALALFSIFENSVAWMAAVIGYPAGIWIGRLTEARENAKGNGLILDRSPPLASVRMAKWQCPCGTELRSSGDIPNPQQWLLHSDVEFADFEGLVDAEAVYASARHAYRCPTCDRLHVYWQGYDEPATVYVPDGA